MFARFLRSEEGNAIVEGVVFLPAMLAAWLGLFVFWDAFEASASAQKATFTAADIVSREMVPVTPALLDGLDRALEHLIGPRFDTVTRYTGFVRTGPLETDVAVVWSYSTGTILPALTTPDLVAKAASLPNLGERHHALLVENVMSYRLPFGVPLPAFLGPDGFTDQVVLRPRFVPKTCLSTLTVC